MNDVNEQALPPDVAKRLSGWFKAFWTFTACHYCFGIVGVAASAVSAATNGTIARVFSIVAAVCMAVVGFVQPDRQYRKYVIAWRLLDSKASFYRHGFISLRALLQAMANAEKALDQIEREAASSGSTEDDQEIPPDDGSEKKK